MKVLICIVVGLVAFVHQPRASATEPKQAPDQPAATPNSTKLIYGTTPAARVPRGYKVKFLDGETVYCRKSTPLGTRFPTEVCLTVAQYEESVRQQDGLRQELTGRQKSYFIPLEPGRGG